MCSCDAKSDRPWLDSKSARDRGGIGAGAAGGGDDDRARGFVGGRQRDDQAERGAARHQDRSGLGQRRHAAALNADAVP